MFGLFKKKSKIDVLHDKYSKLQEDAHRLSNTSRTQSDAKYAEADQVLKEIEALEKLDSK